MTTNKKKGLNIFPLFGDFSLLIIGLFILILLMIISTLHSASVGKAIQTDKYFDSGKDFLPDSLKQEIAISIKESILNDINNIVKKDYSGINNLVGVRIDGHTDIRPPNPEKKDIRRWRTNRELSQFRANEFIPIIQEIFKESYPDSINKKLTSKIFTTGYGPSKPLANSIKENNNWFVVIDKTIDDPMNKDGLIKLKQPSREIADSVANMKNRRVVINILKRGY